MRVCSYNRYYFWQKEKVKVTSCVETGKSLLLRFSQPLSIIGDIELIRDVTVQSQVEAVSECLCIGLPVEYIKNNEIDNPRFLRILLDHLSYKLQTCTTASRVNLLASVENRFASYLLSTVSSNSDGIICMQDFIDEIYRGCFLMDKSQQ